MMFLVIVLIHCIVGVILVDDDAAAPDGDKFLRLNEWFSRVNQAPVQLQVSRDSEFGAGVFATAGSAVKVGQLLIKLPLGYVLCKPTLTAVGGWFGELMTRAFNSVSGDQTAALAFALHVLDSSSSSDGAADSEFSRFKDRFSVWLQALPRPVDGIGALSAAVYAGLPRLDNREPALARTVRQSFEHAAVKQRDIMRSVLAAAAPAALVDIAPLTDARWRWAYSMVASRAWSLRGVKYFAPVVDFFNYQPHPSEMESTYQYKVRGDLFAAHHRVEQAGDAPSSSSSSSSPPQQFLVIEADRDTEPGKELFETYGDNQNVIYFAYHGFVPSVNPSNCVPVTVELAPVSNALVDVAASRAHRDLMAALKLPPRRLPLCLRAKPFFLPAPAEKRRLLDAFYLNQLVSQSTSSSSSSSSAKLLQAAAQVREAGGNADVLFWRSKMSKSMADANDKFLQSKLVAIARDAQRRYQEDEAGSSGTDLISQYFRAQLALLRSWTDDYDRMMAHLKQQRQSQQNKRQQQQRMENKVKVEL